MPATALRKLNLNHQAHGPVRVMALDIAGHVEATGEGEQRTLPTRFPVLKWGSNKTAKGEVIVNEVTLAVLPAVLRESNFDRLPLDFNHNTVPGYPTYQGEPAKIAAMASVEVVRGEGIFFTGAQWTDAGREHVLGGHYNDLSPVVVLNKANEVVAITSAAVCRVGATPDLGLPLSAELFIHTSKTNHMNYRELICAILGVTQIPEGVKATKTAILALLDLPDSAGDKEIQDAATAFAEKASKAKPADDTATKALSAEIDTLKKQLAALEKTGAAAERARIVQLAADQGKVIPKAFLEGDGALDNAKLLALAAELPVTVPLSQRTAAKTEHTTLALSAAEEEVRQRLGISKEDWAKHQKAA